MTYIAPTPDDLRRLKETLELTGEQMSALFALAGGQQWRKYTGGDSPRVMGEERLFYAAARLALSPTEIERVHARMREIGATVDKGNGTK